MHIGATGMAGGVAQSLLHGSEDEFGNGGRHDFVDTVSGLFGNVPLNFIERLLEVLRDHGMDRVHHAVAFEAMRRAGGSGTHHGSEATMSLGDDLYRFITRGFRLCRISLNTWPKR